MQPLKILLITFLNKKKGAEAPILLFLFRICL